jgi:hypothetical protein
MTHEAIKLSLHKPPSINIESCTTFLGMHFQTATKYVTISLEDFHQYRSTLAVCLSRATERLECPCAQSLGP